MNAVLLAALLALVPVAPATSSTGPAPGDAGMPTAGALLTGSTVGASGTFARSRTILGTASWYCRPHRSACTRGFGWWGHYAAACAPLRRLLGSGWRGRTVLVSRGGLTVRVRLIDSCSSRRRAIDLYASAFDNLAPLWRGVIRVRVTT